MSTKINCSHCSMQRLHDNIVIHHCHKLGDISALLNSNVVLFFDDCLFSQYVFLKHNMLKISASGAQCVLGFSANLYRRDCNAKPIAEIESIELHNRVHAGDMNALNGFMTVNEVKELSRFSNVHVACHGYDHIDLERMHLSNVKQLVMFSKDVAQAYSAMEKFGIHTNLFVYPYDYVCYGAKAVLKKYGYNIIWPDEEHQRIYIEELIHNGEDNA